ncbi:acyl-CoA dehydrogenase family protein [Sphingopyxis sp.]|uniref:acyl-CoA dehydrogenase family protein n=1 Tax=Sphingopyxis sp. TaxID=1908224 RepID=UPI003BAA4EEE
MQFQLDEHLSILRDTVHACFQGLSASAPDAQWQAVARELDLFSLTETAGGENEGNNLELMLIFEEAGAALLRLPLLDTLVIAPLLVERGDLRKAIGAGEARMGFAWQEQSAPDVAAPLATTIVERGGRLFLSGTKKAVAAELPLTHLLVTAGSEEGDSVSTIALPVAGLDLGEDIYQSFDGRRMMDLRFDNIEIDRATILHSGADGRLLVQRVIDHAIAANCAEAIGILRRLVDLTVAHITERKQFGKPLSEFQALQHRLADMLAHLEMATAASLRATLSLSDDALRAKAVLAAKITVGRACKFVGENAIQLHGGMGMSEETPVGGYFKRALTLAGLFGSPDQAVRKLAETGPLMPVVAYG